MSAGGDAGAGGRPAIVPFGDGALLVVLGERIDAVLNRRVHVLAAAVRAARSADPRWGAPVPAYASLLVPYDPLAMEQAEANERLGALAASAGEDEAVAEVEGELVEIPVRYGGGDGPDLDEVAARLGLAPEEVIALHAGMTYRVFMLGFAPGFGYLATLPPALVLPRRATPRTRVPVGSVAIAGEQTAVYPVATPGGWHLIGRTDLSVWDPRRDPPALLRPGQRVRFRPVDG